MSNHERMIEVFITGLCLLVPVAALVVIGGLFYPGTLAHSVARFVFSVS